VASTELPRQGKAMLTSCKQESENVFSLQIVPASEDSAAHELGGKLTCKHHKIFDLEYIFYGG